MGNLGEEDPNCLKVINLENLAAKRPDFFGTSTYNRAVRFDPNCLKIIDLENWAA